MMTQRHKGRVLALQALYELDIAGHNPEETIGRLLEEEPAPKESVRFARELVSGVLDRRAEIDGTIRQQAPAWPLEQIPAIERNVLRVAVYEILLDNRVPIRAAINEAVDLAREFGSESSPKFVNGVLGSVSLLATR